MKSEKCGMHCSLCSVSPKAEQSNPSQVTKYYICIENISEQKSTQRPKNTGDMSGIKLRRPLNISQCTVHSIIQKSKEYGTITKPPK